MKKINDQLYLKIYNFSEKSGFFIRYINFLYMLLTNIVIELIDISSCVNKFLNENKILIPNTFILFLTS